MIQVAKIRDLILATAAQAGRGNWISAASGLVWVGDRLFIVPDDENQLAVFADSGNEPGLLVRLIEDELPLENHTRKAEKPDFEALVQIAGGLLAVPSGSTERRTRGVWLGMQASGALSGERREIDFGPLYRELAKTFSELNIEGAVAQNSTFRLFQRGNGAKCENAVIEFDLFSIVKEIAEGRVTAKHRRAVTRYDLGQLHGAPLSFTDATVLDDGRTIFLAAAEATTSTYEDGPCMGSVLGIIDGDGKIISMEELAPRMKAEGIATRLVAGKLEVRIVTDEDDPTRSAELYACTLR